MCSAICFWVHPGNQEKKKSSTQETKGGTENAEKSCCGRDSEPKNGCYIAEENEY